MVDKADDFYLKAVTELGDTQPIIASEDIYAANGLKLVTTGFRINSKLYERLVNHTLKKPLDMSLSSEGQLHPSEVALDLRSQIQGNLKLQRMQAIWHATYDAEQMLSGLKLPEALLFRLTVAKQKYPAFYHRALNCIVVALFLAQHEQMPGDEARMLLLAALFHNTGLMHINPDLLRPGYVMSAAERRHLYVHPLTAYMLLKEFPAFPPEAARAVLEHNERLDGRGYPRGLKGSELSRWGQIVGLSVVSLEAFESFDQPGRLQKLEIRLKLNSKQYGQDLIGYLINFINSHAAEHKGNLQIDPADLKQSLAEIDAVAKLLSELDPQHPSPITSFAAGRYASLRTDLLTAGINISSCANLLEETELGAQEMAEIAPLIIETKWQLNAILSDIARKWLSEIDQLDRISDPRLAWFEKARQALS